jgi:hypothetical protein
MQVLRGTTTTRFRGMGWKFAAEQTGGISSRSNEYIKAQKERRREMFQLQDDISLLVGRVNSILKLLHACDVMSLYHDGDCRPE